MKRNLGRALLGIWLANFVCLGQTTNVPSADLEANAELNQDFIAYQPHYKGMRAERVAKTRALAAKVFAEEAAEKDTACSHQILFELESLLISSSDFKFIDQRLQDLENSLNNPEEQHKALEQDPRDGSWGACYKEWFLKVYASYDQLDKRPSKAKKTPLAALS